MNNQITLGQKIRLFRLRLGLSQREFAKGICTPSMISQIESGRCNPSNHLLQAIVDRLGVSLSDVVENAHFNMKSVSLFWMAKTLLSQSKFSSALQVLDQLEVGFSELTETPDFHFHRALCLIEQDILDEAQTMISLLADPVSKLSDRHSYARAEYLLGRIEMKKQYWQTAQHHFNNTLKALEEGGISDDEVEISALIGFAKAQKHLGNLQAAWETNNRAMTALQRIGDLESQCTLLLEMAQSSLDQQQPIQSAEYAQRALGCAQALNNRYNQLQVELQIASTQAAAGQPELAEFALERIADELLKLNQSTEAGVAFAELSKARMVGGNLAKAEEASQFAKQLLPQNHHHYAEALRVEAYVAKENRQWELAFKRFKQSADCFQLAGSLDEYEATAFELSRMYAEHQQDGLAYKILADLWATRFQVHRRRGHVI
ncbi:helix-turn-helix domain-containing protein [Tumebacillus flagellatus]|uniref:HTH cro/C1-type domain-containing protein n=1 Tax=Tumebacillus flagellatus TaxID=1157490 RepID=A0A074LWD9_9BACL|nr:helix-turn-helix transcriptional regulator [Tumebacillus flagellatus]KEO84915.1 hypothetical protein EL26_02585 [Tumebacillus flagellatus]